MTISQKIFALLSQRKMSQKEFAERTEISQSTISDWKRKGTNPSADKVLRICEVLRVTPYELLDESDLSEISSNSEENRILSKDEKMLLKLFRKLDVYQQSKVLGYLEGLME